MADQPTVTLPLAEASHAIGMAYSALQESCRNADAVAGQQIVAIISDVQALRRRIDVLATAISDAAPRAAEQPIALYSKEQRHGSWFLYPKNATAQALCDLLGTKTLTFGKVADVKALGFSVRTVGETPEIL